MTNSHKLQTLLNLANAASPNFDPFLFQEITVGEVKKGILKISSKAVGSDDISRDMLVLIIDVVSPIITHILNFSISSKSFPTAWKLAHVLPLPKISNPTSLSQYRPISILPIISKILENAVFKQLSSYLVQHNLLSPFQSGFRSLHSTSTALLKVTEDIRHAMDNKNLTILVLLDFSNAFNSVDFEVLLGILRSLNLSSTVLDWFKSYLFDRHQRICADEVYSDWADISAGVPQGGVLSPLLFSVFINEITKIISSPYHLYADDLQLYRHAAVTDLATAVNDLNRDLANIKNWAVAYGLLVNPTKSQAIVIGSRQFRSRVVFDNLPIIVFDGVPIQLSDKVKNLGLIFDVHLSWSHHISDISRRIHYSLHSLKRLQNFLPLKTKILLAQSLLLPLLDYADVCYLDATEELLDKLDRLQNLCIRFIYGLRKFDHISHFRNKLKWLPIRLRRNIHILTLLYKILNSSSPSYLRERFSEATPRVMPVRSCVKLKSLAVPSYNTIFCARSFTVHGTRLWNALPDSIYQNNPSINTFKNRLKQHYLSSLS